MLTLLQIADIVSAGNLAHLDDDTLNDACHCVVATRDPSFMGEEPHLRMNVDDCGIEETVLIKLDNALWREVETRNDARVAARWHQSPPVALPLAA